MFIYVFCRNISHWYHKDPSPGARPAAGCASSRNPLPGHVPCSLSYSTWRGLPSFILRVGLVYIVFTSNLYMYELLNDIHVGVILLSMTKVAYRDNHDFAGCLLSGMQQYLERRNKTYLSWLWNTLTSEAAKYKKATFVAPAKQIGQDIGITLSSVCCLSVCLSRLALYWCHLCSVEHWFAYRSNSRLHG